MGDRVTWFEDCPNCNSKNTLERYEALSSLLKLDKCLECGFMQRYEIDDTNDVITVKKATTKNKKESK